MHRRLTAVPLALVVVLIAAWPAAAADFTVTTEADGTGSCPALRLPCTLRTAITNANAAPGSTIHLPAGHYTLTGALPTISARPLSIVGAGAATTTIDANGTGRVFSVGGESIFALTGVTVANGLVVDTQTPYGGNILVSGASAFLLATEIRVTGGRAANGGGIALRGGRASISYSLIDNNAGNSGGTGGGILASATASTGSGTTLAIADSTVSFNTASAGAGIAATGNPASSTQLERVTVAYNRSTGFPGGGLYMSEPMASFGVKSSIIAGNTGNISSAAVVIGPSECGFYKPTDLGQNVESQADCAFTTGSQNRDPGLAPALSAGTDTPVLALLAGSPAIDRAVDCGTGTRDQRDVSRPQGAACDSGAYEYVAPVAQPTPQPTVAPTATPTPTPTATPVLKPVRNKSVVAKPISGKVLIKVPGAKTFVPLALSLVKNGAEVDVRKGKVEITQAGGGVARFYDGIFKLSQSGGVTTLTLTEKLTGCPKAKSSATAAAKKPKTRKLWGDGKGKFRTRGQYSAATIRGTKWLVQDGCRYTLTRVAQGVVTVRDEVKKKTIILRKGKNYTARPRR